MPLPVSVLIVSPDNRKDGLQGNKAPIPGSFDYHT